MSGGRGRRPPPPAQEAQPFAGLGGGGGGRGLQLCVFGLGATVFDDPEAAARIEAQALMRVWGGAAAATVDRFDARLLLDGPPPGASSPWGEVEDVEAAGEWAGAAPPRSVAERAADEGLGDEGALRALEAERFRELDPRREAELAGGQPPAARPPPPPHAAHGGRYGRGGAEGGASGGAFGAMGFAYGREEPGLRLPPPPLVPDDGAPFVPSPRDLSTSRMPSSA